MRHRPVWCSRTACDGGSACARAGAFRGKEQRGAGGGCLPGNSDGRTGRTTGELGDSVRQGELVDPLPSALGRPAEGAVSRPASDWEQRYRRTVITGDTVVTAFVVAAIGIFFGARDAANWHEKWGILALGTELLVLGALAVSRAWAPAVLGQGAEEFRRLGRSLFTAVVVLALGGIALTSRNIKLWIFVAVPPRSRCSP